MVQTRGVQVLVGLAIVFWATSAGAVEEDLVAMDLEDLMELEVTTATKSARRAADTPAAVTVITHEEIRRSGATSIPDLLRRVPGLNVAQIDANRWAVSARGFNDEYSNKLLVMVDGRSIYTPLFSGIVWAEHDLMLEDIDRIEVVRGPGGTLWGANAVNGVINIITKTSTETQGLATVSRVGTHERFNGASRFGGAIGDNVHYRVYGKFADRADYESRLGGDAHDDWQSVRAGGRLDWQATEDSLVTVQGDFYDADAEHTIAPVGIEGEDEYTGGNVLARASHQFSDTSDMSLQLYYDRNVRDTPIIEEHRDTFDVDFQHSFQPFEGNRLVWGAGFRASTDRISGRLGLGFRGRAQTDNVGSFFLQDEIQVIEDLLSLTIGSKFEQNDYSGFEVQPSARVLVTPNDRHTLWASVSRAVRTPARSDEDVAIFQPSTTAPNTFQQIVGSSRFDAEEVIAYEMGYRTRPLDPVTLDFAFFINDYDDLRSVETVSSFPFGPITLQNQTFFNRLRGVGYGSEIAAQWAVTDFLNLSGGYHFTRTDLSFKSRGADANARDAAETETPRHAFHIGTRINLPWDFEFDTTLFWVDRQATNRTNSNQIDAHARLDMRLGWRVRENLEVSLVGLNVIEPQQEFADSVFTRASDVPRSFYGSVRWLY
ncbi:MAG: TonB-dependent receptor [Myxococcota bacterium]